jgi:hypothetical protein
MTRLRPLLAFTLLAAVTAACGGGDADSVLTLEEYMRRMEAVNSDVQARLDDEVFAADLSADEGAAAYVAIVDGAKEEYRNINPPAEVEAEHDEVREAADEYADAIDEAADDAAEGETLLDILARDQVVSAAGRLNGALCAVQQIAGDNQIQADVGCDR